MKHFTAALLFGAALALGLQSCTTETTQELTPATNDAPQGLQTARFILDEDP